MTGYTIYSGTLHTMTAEANATSGIITGLIAGVTYSVNVVANSTTLPSTVTTASNITISIYTMAIILFSKDIVYYVSPEPATISITSSSPSIMAGDTVTLVCSVTLPSGVIGAPVFQWEGPGVTPTPANPTTSGGMISSVLTFSEISTSQAGLYTCTVILSGSNTTSTIITVQSKLTTHIKSFIFTLVSLIFSSHRHGKRHPSLKLHAHAHVVRATEVVTFITYTYIYLHVRAYAGAA